jgi:hypothetical protein
VPYDFIKRHKSSLAYLNAALKESEFKGRLDEGGLALHARNPDVLIVANGTVPKAEEGGAAAGSTGKPATDPAKVWRRALTRERRG